MRLTRIKRDWALALAPRELARGPEGWIFAALCVLMLILVAYADVRTHQYGTVGGIAFLPVLAGAWLLSGRLTILVTAVAVVTVLATWAFGPVPFVTAMTRVTLIPILALLARLAATNVVRFRDSEIEARQAGEREVRMRELERAKTDFLRLASHELRGPVSILRGYLGMLEDEALGKLPLAARKVVPIMVASTTGISRTIDQMLDAARLEDSRLQLRVRRADLARLVREAAATVDLIHDRSHPLRYIGCDREIAADLDSARIATVVGNLVSNAIKYSPAGTPVVVRMEQVPGQVRVHVTDLGIGIMAADLPRLFTRFGRIVTDENAGITGTGLGLYLSRELARLHGGDITVHSLPGQGSTFTLELPLPKAPAVQRVGPGAARRPLPHRQARGLAD